MRVKKPKIESKKNNNYMRPTNDTIHSDTDLFSEDKELTKAPDSQSDKSLTLLKAMQHMLNASDGSHLNPDLYIGVSNSSDELEYLTGRLGLGNDEAVLLSIIFEKGTDRAVSLKDIGAHLHCGNIEMLQHKPLIGTLIDRGLVSETRKGGYFVPQAVVQALSSNEPYAEVAQKFSSDEALEIELFNKFGQLSSNKISRVAMYRYMYELLDLNKDLRFAKTMERYKKTLNEAEFVFLMELSLQWLIKGKQDAKFSDLSFLLRDNDTANRLESSLLTGSSKLITDGIINNSDNPMNIVDDDSFELTPDTRGRLRPERKKSGDKEIEIAGLLPVKRITKRELFYNDDTAQQVAEITDILTEKKMREVLRRLRDNNMRPGITCLFHGGPGTGKTETVMQLAKATGRDVYQVDFSQIRGKYVGESEKNIKAEFDNYRSLMKQRRRAPIFLFNEADAIICKRMNNAERAIDKEENALQNIILQEMECFEGILIATTNLADNMDKAFERRFLYKVRFNTPDADTLARIWHSMMPSLNDDNALTLANMFPTFAGGQIENITRKATIQNVLHGGETKWDTLVDYCQQEMLSAKPANTIGFRQSTL